MIEKIAVYINSYERVANLSEAGVIKVFLKEINAWKVVQELPLKFYTIKEEKEMQLETLYITRSLGNCRIFVAQEFSSLAFTLFKSMGFSTWKMEGTPGEFLDYILEKEKEEEEEIKAIDSIELSRKRQNIGPVKIGDNGNYILNIRELQEHNTGISSKNALKPFLNNGNFNELIITCSHIPNWLESELEQLGLSFEFSRIGQNDYLAIVKKK